MKTKKWCGLLWVLSLLMPAGTRAETGMGLIVDQDSKKAIRVDLQNDQIVFTSEPFGSRVFSARFSPDGNHLVYVTEDAKVFVCDLSGNTQNSFPVWYSGTPIVSWTRSGIWVSGYGANKLVLYNPDNGAKIREVQPNASDLSDYSIHTVSLDDSAAGGRDNKRGEAVAILLSDNRRVVDLGGGCSTAPSPDGQLFTHNLWESGKEHQTMKVHNRSGTVTDYWYLFDIIPYPANETDQWSWNSQGWSSNAVDIIMIPAGRGFPQMTDSTMPWIYNMRTQKAHCLHPDPYAWDVFWFPWDFFQGKVGPQPVPVRIDQFDAVPTQIIQGDSATLSWSVSHADSVELNGQAVAASDSKTVSPDATSSYTLKAFGHDGPVTRTVTLEVADDPAVEVISFSASDRLVIAGGPVMLSWETRNATSVRIEPEPGEVDPSGNQIIDVLQPTTYRLVAEGAHGPAETQIDIEVIALPVRVNCGPGSPVVEGWLGDEPFAEGGQLWTNPDPVDTRDVPGAAPAEIYRTVRHIGPHSYHFALANGSYVLRLHMADAYSGRSMTIAAEGVTLLADFDINTETGSANRALVKTFEVTVMDGDGLSIDCTDDGDDVFVAGIELVRSLFDILSPRTGDVFSAGSEMSIDWEAFNVNDAVIFFSSDDGATWSAVSSSIDDHAPEWGHILWNVPDVASEVCWIRMEGYFGEAPAWSGPFTVLADSGPADDQGGDPNDDLNGDPTDDPGGDPNDNPGGDPTDDPGAGPDRSSIGEEVVISGGCAATSGQASDWPLLLLGLIALGSAWSGDKHRN